MPQTSIWLKDKEYIDFLKLPDEDRKKARLEAVKSLNDYVSNKMRDQQEKLV